MQTRDADSQQCQSNARFIDEGKGGVDAGRRGGGEEKERDVGGGGEKGGGGG
jgi:hypothetical protein